MRIKSDTGAHLIEIASNDREHLEAMAQAIGGKYQFIPVRQHFSKRLARR